MVFGWHPEAVCPLRQREESTSPAMARHSPERQGGKGKTPDQASAGVTACGVVWIAV